MCATEGRYGIGLQLLDAQTHNMQVRLSRSCMEPALWVHVDNHVEATNHARSKSMFGHHTQDSEAPSAHQVRHPYFADVVSGELKLYEKTDRPQPQEQDDCPCCPRCSEAGSAAGHGL